MQFSHINWNKQKCDSMKINNKLFLYLGLGMLAVAIVLRSLTETVYWIPTLVIAIALKAIFLFNSLRVNGFKFSLWLKLISVGVVMILISMLFKHIFPIPILRNILFYGAIALKVSGLTLMIINKYKTTENQ